jgi:hypothetical protein
VSNEGPSSYGTGDSTVQTESHSNTGRQNTPLNRECTSEGHESLPRIIVDLRMSIKGLSDLTLSPPFDDTAAQDYRGSQLTNLNEDRPGRTDGLQRSDSRPRHSHRASIDNATQDSDANDRQSVLNPPPSTPPQRNPRTANRSREASKAKVGKPSNKS